MSIDLQIPVSDLSSEIINCVGKLESSDNCCDQAPSLQNKPWAYKFDTGSGIDNCSPIFSSRHEKGWSLEFVFNKNGLDWSDGSVFYYIGTRGEDDPQKYADNNLSFQFTSDGRIRWVTIRYSGDTTNCDSGYTRNYYVSSGQTPTLHICEETKDFHVAIVFDRYKYYTDCDLLNEGGVNDLITGSTVLNPYDVLTGATPIYEETQILNPRWDEERDRRLGVLKIYLNGRPIYKIINWEEIIPRDGDSVQPFIQSWGGGTGLMNNVHDGVCCFDIKKIRYYTEPLSFVYVKYNFLILTETYDLCVYNTNECDYIDANGVNNIISLINNGLLAEDGKNLLTENDNLLII
jgi:hypothetical protein